MSLLTKLMKSDITFNRLRDSLKELIQPKINTTNQDNSECFLDSHNNNFFLDRNLRSIIKPGWEAMFTVDSFNPDKYTKSLKYKIRNSARKIKKIEKDLSFFNVSFQNKIVVDIGCYDGIDAHMISTYNTEKVIGTDVVDYYINQESGKTEKSVDSKILDKKRSIVNEVFGKKYSQNNIEIINDDITKSEIGSNSADIILSWETLEHLNDVEKAFSEIYRILKPGGISIHEYNPFFAINGGHSLCTLDFLWGHARLSQPDFERYLNVYRPKEKHVAMSFYNKNLNRLNINLLNRIIQKYNFSYYAIIPLLNRYHLDLLNKEIVEQVKSNYENITVNDLASPIVKLLIQK